MAEKLFNVHEKKTSSSICADSEAGALDAKFTENLRLEDGSNDAENSELQILGKQSAALTDVDIGMRQDLMSEKRKRLDSDKDPNLPVSVTEAIQKDENCGKPLAFNIPIENCHPSRQPPKRLCNVKKSGKTSIDNLNEKQALAEERRQHYKENRLKRIRERQEACRKLAQNVDTLLQQRALAQGVADGAVKHMTPSEILATAHLVSQNFRALTIQLGNDLAVKDKGKEKMHKQCQDENQDKSVRVSCSQKKYPSSVSFTVSCDSGNSPVKPKLTPKLHQKKKRTLTAEEIEEKQRAEERRNKKMELRAQRTRENREALIAMALDIEKFEKLQSAAASANDVEDLVEQNKNAALLAEKLANQFDRLNKRYSEDLERAENFQISHSIMYLGP
ncbi:uncharacterized protein LOC116287111 [Actinia tenebrosa]|uniref:Uncharacterized protein LOC116287111 n=1 Tax=Actinia tenebrosa TaxID=6105 RepID=A0A6P8HAT0_ACTTE|nr:uncharacterized protein LOC116287111 [Actinia tenebrosa]